MTPFLSFCAFCYQSETTGAVEILKNLDKIDFNLLYAGKVCIDELPRVKRLARLDCLKLPHFLHNMEEYRKQLYYIAAVNGLSVAKSAKKSARIKSGTRQKSAWRQFSAKPSLKCIAVNNTGCIATPEVSDTEQLDTNQSALCNHDNNDARKCVTDIVKDDVDSISSYSYCPSTTISSPRTDPTKLSVDDQSQSSRRAITEDTPSSINSAKSRPISEYKASTHLPSSCQTSGYTYKWQSVRTPSPAMVVRSDECDESPIPYSPARWLRRRKMSSPNILPRKQASRESLTRKIHPTSVVKL